MSQRINRIYFEGPIKVRSYVELPPDAVRHLATVLKVKVNDPIILFNNSGFEFHGRIEEVGKRLVKVEVIDQHSKNLESPFVLHLIQAVARGDKMDWIIQKSVELGVSTITPLFSERTGVKLSHDRLMKKLDHWQKVIISACEQCGRNELPLLNAPLSFEQLLISAKQLPGLLQLNPHTGKTIDSLSQGGERTIVIGPEGGLSDKEVEQLQQVGAEPIKMGPRILRTETAALVALSLLQSQFGDLN